MACSSVCLLVQCGSSFNVITFEPVGILHSPYQRFYDAPRQPGVDGIAEELRVELYAHKNYEQALEDLSGCTHIWLVVYFHRAEGWKPKVLPPRGRTKRGVFATRSPHRPNPIGITSCELVRVDGRNVYVRGTDLMDQTPVLDIKPYVAYADAHPESRVDWIDGLEESVYAIEGGSRLANELPADVARHVMSVLGADPLPHPYRRIECLDGEVYEIAVREYRVYYTLRDTTVTILRTHVVL